MGKIFKNIIGEIKVKNAFWFIIIFVINIMVFVNLLNV